MIARREDTADWWEESVAIEVRRSRQSGCGWWRVGGVFFLLRSSSGSKSGELLRQIWWVERSLRGG